MSENKAKEPYSVNNMRTLIKKNNFKTGQTNKNKLR